MPRSRLLALTIGISIVLGLAIWLISSVAGLYSQILWASGSPLLANLLLLLILIVVGVLIAVLVSYLQPLWKPKRKRRRHSPKPPQTKPEAVSQTLEAVRKQVTHIHDEVTRRVLLSRSREIEANVARGDVQIVVFGTGSAGKTSLVNALLGRVLGRVSAPMGTTQEGATYALKLKGLTREVIITDTPGILEAGIAGTERGEMARRLATEADLLLFVVDNDISLSEYEPLKVLAVMGKRSLLVFNKIDLYTDEDREAILAKLRSRVKSFIRPRDVVAATANPLPVELETGEQFSPDPDIMPLVRRIVAVLRAEGEDLIADNILLQSQRLGDETRRLLEMQRRRQAEKIVDRYQWIGAVAIACTPVPGIDLLATAAVNAQMVVELGKVYGCELDMERGRELALSLGKTLVSLGVVKGAIQAVATALQFHLGTLLVGKAVQGVTAAYLTRIAGKSFIEYFRQDGDWGDGGITEVVKRQFQLVKKEAFMKAFVKDAIAKVVEPLQMEARLEEDEGYEYEDEYFEEFASSDRSPSPTDLVFDDRQEDIEDDWETSRDRREEW